MPVTATWGHIPRFGGSDGADLDRNSYQLFRVMYSWERNHCFIIDGLGKRIYTPTPKKRSWYTFTITYDSQQKLYDLVIKNDGAVFYKKNIHHSAK